MEVTTLIDVNPRDASADLTPLVAKVMLEADNREVSTELPELGKTLTRTKRRL